MTTERRRKLITPAELDLTEEPPPEVPPKHQRVADRLRVRAGVAEQKRRVSPPSTKQSDD